MAVLPAKGPDACLVPLLLAALLCAGILELSRQQKAWCLLGTPPTTFSVTCRHPGTVSPAEGPVPAWYPYYYSISVMCGHLGSVSPAKGPDAFLVPLLLAALLCAGILELSRQQKAWCLLGTPPTTFSVTCRHPRTVSPAEGPVPAWYPYYYSVSVMCRHLGSVSPAEGPVPAWYPYYYSISVMCRHLGSVSVAEGPMPAQYP